MSQTKSAYFGNTLLPATLENKWAALYKAGTRLRCDQLTHAQRLAQETRRQKSTQISHSACSNVWHIARLWGQLERPSMVDRRPSGASLHANHRTIERDPPLTHVDLDKSQIDQAK